MLRSESISRAVPVTVPVTEEVHYILHCKKCKLTVVLVPLFIASRSRTVRLDVGLRRRTPTRSTIGSIHSCTVDTTRSCVDSDNVTRQYTV